MLSPSIIVVGAGPAGSTAARLLAQDGARVTLLEARRLPRDKACGGGVTSKALRSIPSAALETAEGSIHKYEFRGGRLPPFHLDEPEAEITMIRRASFDYALAEAAANAGAAVCDGERVVRVVEDVDGVTATTRHGSIRADYLIAADGDPSGTARQLGLGGVPVRRSLTLSALVPSSASMPDDTAVVSFTVARGYAWYFPKGDHASIGVGSAIASGRKRGSISAMRGALDRFAEHAGVPLGGQHLTGHWVPQGSRRGQLASQRCLLVGDAAAIADPLFGEGIAYAIRTGSMAAQALRDIAEGRAVDLRPYEERLHATFQPSMRRLRLAARVVDWSPSFALTAARISPWVRAYGANVVSGLRTPFAFASLDASPHTAGKSDDPMPRQAETL